MITIAGMPEPGPEWEEVEQVTEDDDGIFVFSTIAQTMYIVGLDGDRRDLIRLPRVATMWVSDDTGREVHIDGRTLPITEIVTIRVGERGLIRVDTGEPGWHARPLHSTPIVQILRARDI